MCFYGANLIQINLDNHITLNRLHIVRFIPILVIALLLLFGYVVQRANQSGNSGTQCQLQDTDECVLSVNNQRFSVQMLDTLQVEEELLVKLKFPARYRLEKSWIQGVNMYMGKTALSLKDSFSDETQTVSELTFFLGACSENKMKWQLVLIYQNPVSGEEHKQFYNFSTDTGA